METLRDKSKRLLKQTQTDTDAAIQDFIQNRSYSCVKDFNEAKQTIINIHLLDLSDDIKTVTEKLENLVSNPSIRPDVRKDILGIISLLV